MTTVTRRDSAASVNTTCIIIFNDKGIIVMSDPCVDHVFDLKSRESIGMPIDKLIPSLFVQPGEEIKSTDSLLKSNPAGQVVLGIKKSGREFYLEVIVHPFRAGNEFLTTVMLPAVEYNSSEATTVQAITNIEAMNRDLQEQIYKRKMIEEKFIKIQRTYDTMVQNFPDGVIGVLNKEMKYVLVDGKELDNIDLPAMGLTGNKKSESHDPVVAEETLFNLKKAFSGEHVTFDIAAKDQVYNVIAVPLLDAKGNITEILCVLRNITKSKQLEAELIKTIEKEKELGDLKSRFITMASHEFRTPLSTILSSTYLLENYKGTDFEREKLPLINRIKRGVNNLTMILNEFLSLEKFEQGNFSLLPSDIDIPSLIKDVISEMGLSNKEGQVIHYEHEGHTLVEQLDHRLLWSITTNLINNAIKYSSENSTITINSSQSSTGIKISINDQGMGIPRDEQQHIFERFFRAHNAINIEGTGLGLHIVQKCVNLLNGTVSFTSQLGVGTTFNVWLPPIKPPDLVNLNRKTVAV